jgi:hypothetical protein
VQASLSQFPDLQNLTAGLTSVFRSTGRIDTQVTIVEREPNIYASTFPSEIVTCLFDDGSKLRLFCKYEAGHFQSSHGHRGGIAYEASVYRHLLQPLGVSVSTFYGAYTDVMAADTWLILEYLENSISVKKLPGAAAMGLAARWIGQFHAVNEARLSGTPRPCLNTYDVEYYRGWARRTSLSAGPLHDRFPWLRTLCAGVERFAAPLLEAPPTVIHGEYYPHTVLLRGGRVYPVDWESAAIGAGEIDLASLTEDWPADIARQLERDYQQARWPAGAPAGFARTLAAARLYLHLRWLGDRPSWTTHESHLWRFEQLRAAGEQLGLI